MYSTEDGQGDLQCSLVGGKVSVNADIQVLQALLNTRIEIRNDSFPYPSGMLILFLGSKRIRLA